MSFEVKLLPPQNLDESKPILRKLASAHRYLAELKGLAASIPNQSILIDTLVLQEAKDSSAIENLIEYINRREFHEVDPLIKMAIIHFQFETIHPFYDGNGRTGRIINLLYLIMEGMLSSPILYLSRYIIRNKAEYYRLLQNVRETNQWEAWVLYMLEAVEQTSQETILLVDGIKKLMMEHKHRIRAAYPKIYSQDLINSLFRHPYTKIEFLMNDLSVSRLTATKYLDTLAKGGLLVKEKIWRSNYYINQNLFKLLQGENLAPQPAPPIISRHINQV